MADNLFGGDNSGGFVMGALLGRLLFNQNGVDGATHNQNADRAAIDSAVAAALASANQQNNNSMLLLKDIQDTGQDVVRSIDASTSNIVNTINTTSQTALVQQLQSQLANLQGQSDIKSAIAASTGTLVNEVHESNQDLSNQLNAVNTNMLNGFNNLASKIDANLITELNNEIAALRTRQAVDTGNVTVTNNINQMQQQAQQQQQLNQVVTLLPGILAELQQAKNSMVNIGGLISGSGQTASPVSVR